MFVQIIRGKASDEGGLRKQVEKWQQELAPTATGYLGSTGGIASDGRMFLAARFESAEAAQANSDKPEQGAWWAETERYLSGVTFANSIESLPWMGGGSDDAGFVQVMSYKVNDVDKAKELWAAMVDMPMDRPDLIGGLTVLSDGAALTDIVYFTSEAEARASENQRPEGEAAAIMEQWGKLIEGEIDYLDLTEPWLFGK